MEHPNIDIARCLWDAIATGDRPGICKLLAEKAEWRMCGRSVLAGVHSGAEEILDFMARSGELTEDLRSELIEIFVNDGGAVLRYSIHAVNGTASLDTEHLFMIRIVDGRITEAIFAPVDQYEYDRFYSPRRVRQGGKDRRVH
jgi:ketosteroid isomerase-like protein